MGDMADDIEWQAAVYQMQYENHIDNIENNFNHGIWETKDGDEIPFCRMEDSHLLNTIAWLKRNKNFHCSEGYIEVMQYEYDFRRLKSERNVEVPF